jgi:hypothetical protein
MRLGMRLGGRVVIAALSFITLVGSGLVGAASTLTARLTRGAYHSA